MVHGTRDTVNRILDHPDIASVSFVGSGARQPRGGCWLGMCTCRPICWSTSTADSALLSLPPSPPQADSAGRYIYERGCANGKRVQANMGAKNHAVIMPDAPLDATVSALAGAAFGAAGQRCMAISAAVFVGGTGPYRQALVDKAKSLKVGVGGERSMCVAAASAPREPATAGRPAPPASLPPPPPHAQVSAGWEAGADIGPVISPEAKQRIERLIAGGIREVRVAC